MYKITTDKPQVRMKQFTFLLSTYNIYTVFCHCSFHLFMKKTVQVILPETIPPMKLTHSHPHIWIGHIAISRSG